MRAAGRRRGRAGGSSGSRRFDLEFRVEGRLRWRRFVGRIHLSVASLRGCRRCKEANRFCAGRRSIARVLDVPGSLHEKVESWQVGESDKKQRKGRHRQAGR